MEFKRKKRIFECCCLKLKERFIECIKMSFNIVVLLNMLSGKLELQKGKIHSFLNGLKREANKQIETNKVIF